MSRKYVVKCGDYYATGGRTWSKAQFDAFVFTDRPPLSKFMLAESAKNWAQAHADSFKGEPMLFDEPLPLGKIRVVRLVRGSR